MELHPASLSPDNLQKGQTCWNHCAKPCSCLLGLGLAETTSRAPRHQRVSGGALHSRGRRKQGTLGLRVKSRSVGAARASLGPTPPSPTVSRKGHKVHRCWGERLQQAAEDKTRAAPFGIDVREGGPPETEQEDPSCDRQRRHLGQPPVPPFWDWM